MWEDEAGWNEEAPEGEPEVEQMFCLREEMEEQGGIRTLEQEISSEEASKMNFKGKWIKVEAEVTSLLPLSRLRRL